MFFELVDTIATITGIKNEKAPKVLSDKEVCDRFAEAEFSINNETDPLKKRKMQVRLACGITDFSDL